MIIIITLSVATDKTMIYGIYSKWLMHSDLTEGMYCWYVWEFLENTLPRIVSTVYHPAYTIKHISWNPLP